MKNQSSYDVELAFIKDAVNQAISEILTQDIKHKERKEAYDVVTEIDYSIEKFLIAKIKEKFPQDIVLSEEYNPNVVLKGRTWTIDPIDGTFNFASGSPLFGVQCALIEEGEIVVALIVLPKLGEKYWAVKDQGSYLNNIQIHVNKEFSLEQALISINDYHHPRPEEASFQHRVMADLYPNVGRIRMYGSAAIDFSYVASGKTAATIIMTQNLWDIAPGILIAKEAGALISSPEGGVYSFADYGVIVSANKVVKDQIISSLKSAKQNKLVFN